MEQRTGSVSGQTALDAWAAAKIDHRITLLTNAEAHALAYIADHAIAEQAAEIARLKAGLDEVNRRHVLHCMDRDLDAVMTSSGNESEGSLIRTTDTGRELTMTGHGWREISG